MDVGSRKLKVETALVDMGVLLPPPDGYTYLLLNDPNERA